jgi:hypothetical protein
MLMVTKLSDIGIFSSIILVFAVIAIVIVFYLSVDIATMTVEAAKSKYPSLELESEDRDFNYWDTVMVPIFIAQFINVFEGGQNVINLYSEAQRPQDFLKILFPGIFIMNYIVPLGAGYASYFAFGHATKACILYSLPAGELLSSIASLFFILSIMGSYVLLS